MPAFNKMDNFTEHVLEGVHGDFRTTGDAVLKLALVHTTIPTATMTLLSELTEIASYAFVSTISGTNLASRVCQNVLATQDVAGTADLKIDDMPIAASGGTIPDFQWLVLYDDTPASPLKPLIGWVDYGSVLSLADGESLVVDFAATGLFTLV